MSEEHRGVLGATIAAAARIHGFESSSLKIEIASVAGRADTIVSAKVGVPARELRRTFMPYLAALRSISSDATLDTQDGSVTIQFSYGES